MKKESKELLDKLVAMFDEDYREAKELFESWEEKYEAALVKHYLERAQKEFNKRKVENEKS